jgi:hypothetical protein
MEPSILQLSQYAQYKEEIEEIIIESEHVYRLTIDYELLNQRFEELICSARDEGLDEKIIWNMIQSRIPAYINFMNYKISNKKSA